MGFACRIPTVRRFDMALSRRNFIGLTGLGIGLTALPPVVGSAGILDNTEKPIRMPSDRIFRSSGGKLSLNLIAAPGTVNVAGARHANVQTYNGRLPGPMIVVSPGDRLRINLQNQTTLPTNLHYHGMHVSPKGHQDNVFVQIPTGGDFDYDVRIPNDHPGGLYWYHPHWHPNVGPQVWGGMSGLLMVRGGAAALPELKNVRRRVFSLRQVAFTPDGELDLYGTTPPEDQAHLVNGQIIPEVSMRPGETQFWQFANIGVNAYYRLQLPNHTFTVVEEDGIKVWQTWETDSLLMPPGKRYGFLVTAQQRAGLLNFMQAGYNQGFDDWPKTPLMRVRVKGEPAKSVTLPEGIGDKPSWLSGPVKRRRVLTLSQNVVDGQPLFYIDGMLYDNLTMADVPRVLVNSTEEWVVRNASSPLGGSPHPEDHPFHIHINGFAVVERGDWNPATNQVSNRKIVVPRGEADTENVPSNGYIKFRTKFADYVGRSVYHCHILFHEDHGMMGVFDVVNEDGIGPGPGQLLDSELHQHN